MPGTVPTAGSGPPSPPPVCASTRPGPPWAGLTGVSRVARDDRRALCLVVEHEARSGAENMALDQTLLDLAEQTGEGFLRLYGWSPSCLSFGRHEPALRRYDRTLIETLGLDVVRRPTGGRAVWHARELTYAVAAPVSWFGTLSQSYCEIHQILARAIVSLGAPATLAPAEPTAGVG